MKQEEKVRRPEGDHRTDDREIGPEMLRILDTEVRA